MLLGGAAVVSLEHGKNNQARERENLRCCRQISPMCFGELLPDGSRGNPIQLGER